MAGQRRADHAGLRDRPQPLQRREVVRRAGRPGARRLWCRGPAPCRRSAPRESAGSTNDSESPVCPGVATTSSSAARPVTTSPSLRPSSPRRSAGSRARTGGRPAGEPRRPLAVVEVPVGQQGRGHPGTWSLDRVQHRRRCASSRARDRRPPPRPRRARAAPRCWCRPASSGRVGRQHAPRPLGDGSPGRPPGHARAPPDAGPGCRRRPRRGRPGSPLVVRGSRANHGITRAAGVGPRAPRPRPGRRDLLQRHLRRRHHRHLAASPRSSAARAATQSVWSASPPTCRARWPPGSGRDEEPGVVPPRLEDRCAPVRPRPQQV